MRAELGAVIPHMLAIVVVVLGQIVGGLSPQQAMDAPRICIEPGLSSAAKEDGDSMDRAVFVEDGMSEETIKGLEALGHKVEVVRDIKRTKFGKGQIIRWSVDPVEGTGVWSAGSDLRGDGAAYPQ